MRSCTPSVDWNDLRYFLAVARSGSLAGAARDLGVEHTTVSRRLGALESDLGARLFARGPAGLTLTEAGRGILPCVEVVSEQAETIERRVAGVDGKAAGTVKLTIPEAGNAYFLEHLRVLRERHPELVIEVLSDNRALDLRRGEADIAVRFRDHADPELIARRAGSAGWSLYASNEYVARKGELAALDVRGHDVIGFDASLAEVEGARWLRERGDVANIVLRANSIAAAATAAAFGMGLVPLPCFVASSTPALVRLTPEVIGRRDILLVAHPDLVKVARVRATMDFLMELFARDRTLWSGES
jgi:DNA-binding transcriptional LysR family regulator